jgi:hypothetical protein
MTDGSVAFASEARATVRSRPSFPIPVDKATTTSAAEGVAADADGNIYGAEVGPKGVKKYVRAPAIPRTADGRPDLQGIWKRAAMPDFGTLPYLRDAAAKQRENFAQRTTADPLAECFLPVCRASCIWTIHSRSSRRTMQLPLPSSGSRCSG